MMAVGGSINILTYNNFIYIQPKIECSTDNILHGPRVGLSNKYLPFKDLPYRFVLASSLKFIKRQKTKLQPYWGRGYL